MGESRRKREVALTGEAAAGVPQVVDTPGGRVHVRWDEGAAATPHAQLVFFAEFLATTGVFDRWVSGCPLEYRSGNAAHKGDVLGTLMLGLVAGHRRNAHITALRGDSVAAQALRMKKVVSEDALRRALERIDEAAIAAWLRPSLQHSVREALDRPWVLDIDAGIKPLYGRQHLTSLHSRADVLKRLVANIGAALRDVRATAEQFKDLDRWGCLLRYISDRIAPVIVPPRSVTGLPAAR